MSWFNKEAIKYDLSAEFDIEGLEVFSVEREGQSTVFGYLREGVEHEWYIATTDEQHVSFVARLTYKLKQRNQNANQIS